MEQQMITNGGLQIVPQIAVQYVYLDFDGELTSYNGEILTVDNVEVQNSSLTEERIADITAELNALYADQNVIFVTEKPENTAYSTVFIGKTDAFNAYGSFKGVAETIDKGNLNRSDNAFVMLDASAADTEIISTISHETDHLLGILDHGGSGLYAYADSSVNSGEIFIGKVLTNEKMHVNSGGTVVSTIVDSCGELHVSNGGTANFALLSGYKAAMYISSGGVANSTTVNTTSGGASMCVFEGGAAFDTTLNGYYAYMYVSNGGSAHNITLTKSAAIWGWEGGVVSNITLDSAGSAVAAHGAVLNDINVYSGDINVYDDARVNNVTLHSSGAVMTVGGKAVDVTVYAGGSVQMGTYGSVDNITVHSGGNLLRVVEHNAFTNLTVNSGGIINHFMIAEDKFWEHISSGPVYLADNVYILNSTIYINEGGVANGIVANPNATTSNYATINIYSGGTASNVTMNSRSHLHISSGALADSAAVNSSGYIYVSAGGSAENTMVNHSGCLYVYDSGAVKNTVVSGGSMFVYSGAAASDNEVSNYGNMYVEGGGTVSNTSVTSQGNIFISSGAAANNTTMKMGNMHISAGGTADGIVLSHYSDLYISGSAQANNININSMSLLQIGEGGAVANNTVINDFGGAYVNSGATMSGVTVNSGGSIYINTDTTVYGLTLSAGGQINAITFAEDRCFSSIENAETVIDENIYLRGKELHVSEGGAISGAGMNISAGIFVYSGGIASDTTLNMGGEMHVKGGSAVNTVLTSGGAMYISSGGNAVSTTVNSGAWMYILIHGTASDTVVESGANLIVSSGGTVKNMVANGGNITLLNGSYADTILIAGSSTIECDYEVTYIIAENTRMTNKDFSVTNDISVRGVYIVTADGYWSDSTIYDGGIAYVMYTAEAANITVDAGGSLYIAMASNASNIHADGGVIHVNGGGILSDATISSNGMLYLYGGAILNGVTSVDGMISLEGAVSNNGTINFVLTDRISDSTPFINDIYSLTGGSYSADVTNAVSGEYLLAAGAESFEAAITIRNESGEIGSLKAGETVTVNGATYSLQNNNSTLSLTVEIDNTPPETPEMTASTTALTASSVTVSAAYSSDTAVKEYSLDNENWQEYSGDGVVMEENGTVYFRGIDAAGNISKVVSYIVNNIDRIAPEIPEGLLAFLDADKDVILNWKNAVDNGVAGIKGYMIRYGTSENLSGEGEFIGECQITLADLKSGSYYYQIRAVDNAGNASEWSSVRSFSFPGIKNLKQEGSTVSWDALADDTKYSVEFSSDNFTTGVSFETAQNAIDLFAAGDRYGWRIHAEGKNLWSYGPDVTGGENGGLIVSEANGNMDLFIAGFDGVWDTGYAAQHQGILNGWKGTAEQVSLDGKNNITDIIQGSADANILVMTDDANGDALFVDDIFSALPGTVAEQQARIAQIDEIRAGAGDDIVDMTSQRFACAGNGVTVYGGLGNDTIWANTGNNTLFGDAGNDSIVGGSGDDVIIGGIGDDYMHGGGGNDTFCFGNNWGVDTVEQLTGGKVTLWFESGSADNWNADTLTYSDGENSVTVSGVSADNITLIFGDDNSLRYDDLAASGCFDNAASEKIFEDKNKGMLA